MKPLNFLRTLVSIVLVVLATTILLGELTHFEILLFVVIKVVGLIVLVIGVVLFPYSLNLSWKQEVKAEIVLNFFVIMVLCYLILYLIF